MLRGILSHIITDLCVAFVKWRLVIRHDNPPSRICLGHLVLTVLRNGIHRLISISLGREFCLIETSEVTTSLCSCCGGLDRSMHESVLLDVHLTVIAPHTFHKGTVALICCLRLDVIEV